MHSFFVDQIFTGNLIVAMFVAAIAGVISFFSPCVLPLVPGYLSYAAGMSEVRSRGRVALGSLLFVIGFSTLFISYGVLFGSLGAKINSHSNIISIILGLLTIFMGVVFLFNQKFYRSFKPTWKTRTGLVGAPVLGFLFGIGWTPCIGPTLGAVQALSFETSSALRGAVLSFAYCLGLGVPFLLVGIFFDQSQKLRRFISRHGNRLTLVGGIFLILIGILQVSGLWNDLMNSIRDLISGFIPVI
ncbi:MAG: cytochrome c biogenesis CcdA family protein [Actinobacteria bacterium]|jgi:cytochrome c-type biogenesis protein|nr:cytochrome c biogenesis CcdA family protein [Actinomycetota bacterium]